MLKWKCLAGTDSRTSQALALPDRFITQSAVFESPDLPLECLALLPSGQGSLGLITDINTHSGLSENQGIGLFLNDPFLNITQVANLLETHKIGWITNLPSIAQHEESLRRDLYDVGISMETELARLAEFRQQGVRTLAAISTLKHAAMLDQHPADAVVVLQTTEELQVSFPSFATRKPRYLEIRKFLRQHNDNAYVLPILSTSETAQFREPALLRPVMLESV